MIAKKEAVKTELNEDVVTESGTMWVRTLSHYLFIKKPRTTIFLKSNPYDGDKIITFLWDTAEQSVLSNLHYRIVVSLNENGFSKLKEAVGMLTNPDPIKQTAGKVKLVVLIKHEVANHVKFVS